MTPDPKDSLNGYQLVGPSEGGKINNLLAELKARESAQRLAWVRLYFAIFAPSGNTAASIANWHAIRLPISILRLVLFLAGAAKVRALTKCGCAR
jgi:hypothetical protein